MVNIHEGQLLVLPYIQLPGNLNEHFRCNLLTAYYVTDPEPDADCVSLVGDTCKKHPGNKLGRISF